MIVGKSVHVPDLLLPPGRRQEQWPCKGLGAPFSPLRRSWRLEKLSYHWPVRAFE